jgi:flagellar FliL protein
MKLKLLIPVIALVVLLGAGYKFALAKPKVEPKPHVAGTVYILGKDFLINLRDNRFLKLTAGLVLDAKDESTAAAGGESAAKPPEGFGTMSQEGLVRQVITDELTNAQASDLMTDAGREAVRKQILKDLRKQTDVKVDDVVFTDITIQ